MNTKQCSMCQKVLSASQFNKQSNAPDGLQSRCKNCRKLDYQNNKEREYSKHLEWTRNNKDKHHAYRLKSYTKDIEKSRSRARHYYASERGHLNGRIQQNKRRAREKNAEGKYTIDDVKKQYEHQMGKCYWCNKNVGKNFHVDHKVPLSRGGQNSPENIVISCKTCNLAKYNKLENEWIR